MMGARSECQSCSLGCNACRRFSDRRWCTADSQEFIDSDAECRPRSVTSGVPQHAVNLFQVVPIS